MTQVPLRDIVGYTLARGHTNVLTQIVKRPSRVGLHLLAIKIITLEPSKKQRQLRQQPWLHMLEEEVIVVVDKDLMASNIRTMVPRCQHHRQAKEPCLPHQIQSLLP